MNATYYGNVSEGFYSTFPLKGFQNSGNNKNNTAYQSYAAEDKGSIGYPTCREWWEGAGAGFNTPDEKEVGLRSRLLKEAERFKTNTDVLQFITGLFDTTQTKENELLYAAFFNEYGMEKIQNAEMRDYSTQTTGFWDTAIGYGSRFAGILGTAASASQELAGASVVQAVAPIGQAIILFVLTAFLPLAYIVSKYGRKFIVGYHFFIASVLFWPYLWELCILVQQGFTETVFGGSESYIDQALTNPSTLIWVNYLTDALFISIPGLLTGVMTAAGMQVGNSMTTATNGVSGGQAAKNAGASGAAKLQQRASEERNSGTKMGGGGKGGMSKVARATPKGQMAHQAKNKAQNRFKNRHKKS
ncbi:conjugal transfer protein TraG N-terminal domain-containing protein [Alteromonas sp. ASW11-130]|uniref:conjugal transfer protein TraG N-terminal domain-containing protein n=1 Tax=Alteromonas sp. ASW11-130 TaxID=3015775 RepID=UPI002241BCE5|nr:conjugal transfer protein TraG N-terminal domain-containing protein [Alteromonas sp. ASW11-130]MCW8090682.1 conjugal transfer protein TraG N-terminal domain-containing protein [Alteromonas sp. ASW11-130]